VGSFAPHTLLPPAERSLISARSEGHAPVRELFRREWSEHLLSFLPPAKRTLISSANGGSTHLILLRVLRPLPLSTESSEQDTHHSLLTTTLISRCYRVRDNLGGTHSGDLAITHVRDELVIRRLLLFSYKGEVGGSGASVCWERSVLNLLDWCAVFCVLDLTHQLSLE
jgi:hypothetical protein